MDSEEVSDDDLDEKELDIKLDITKKSRKINRPVQFGDQPGRILEEIPTDTKILSQYIAKTPISRVIQCSSVYAESQINTIRAEFTSQGMNHCEGGWPKDVNPLETDQTMRFRKKVEKDENYVKTVCNLSSMMESCIKQNNAIEIYEEYFTEIDEATDCEAPKAKTVNLFRDQESLKLISWKRPVSSLAWCPDGERIAITYCSLEFLGVMADTPKTSYIFHIDDPTHPDIVLTPPFHLVSSEFNPKDGNLLAGGCNNGQVCWWDGRKGGKPEGEISLDHSHTEPVYKTKWVSSKTCSQFFSASTDGLVKWWDIRKFTTPVETLELGPANSGGELTQVQGATCLEYEPTIPTKFMVGTDQGMVLACNRKAKSDNERIVGIYQAHFGPVYALERNPCFPKNFLTIGDWCARLWSEDIKESAIMWTSSYTENLRDGCWSPTRPSVFFTARQDGVLDTWDILYQQRTPILSTKITDDALNCVKVHEQGCLVAIGCNNGNVSLIELSESLSTSHKNEKSSVTAMFERETRREKILEARAKELRLKEKTKGMAGLSSQMMQRKKQSGPPGTPGAQEGGEDPALQGLSANMNRPGVGRGRGGAAQKKRIGFQSAFQLYKNKAQKNGSQADDEIQEDPCIRAEREFYQAINEEKAKRIEMNKDIKPDAENL